MAIRKNLMGIVLVGATGLIGCEENNVSYKGLEKTEQENAEIDPFAYGTVIDEIIGYGQVVYYAIKFQIGEDIYSAEIVGENYSKRNRNALALAIEPGTKIRIPKKYLGSNRFEKDKIGFLNTDEIVVLGKQREKE